MPPPKAAIFKSPYLSLLRKGESSQVTSASVAVDGTGGMRTVALTLHGTSLNEFLSKITLSGELHNMASLSRLLHMNCPTAGIYGESEWVIATELPNGNLLMCIRPDTKMVMIEEDSAAFILDAFSLPGTSFRPQGVSSVMNHPSVTLNWNNDRKVQEADARLWQWKEGNEYDLINTLVETHWVIFDNVVL